MKNKKTIPLAKVINSINKEIEVIRKNYFLTKTLSDAESKNLFLLTNFLTEYKNLYNQ